MSPDRYNMVEVPEHQLNKSSFLLNQFLNKDLRSDNSRVTVPKESLATPEVERRIERAGEVGEAQYQAAMAGPAAGTDRGGHS